MRKLVSMDKELYVKLIQIRPSLAEESPLLALINDCISVYERSQGAYRDLEFYDENKTLLSCRPVTVTNEQLALLEDSVLPEELVRQFIRLNAP